MIAQQLVVFITAGLKSVLKRVDERAASEKSSFITLEVYDLRLSAHFSCLRHFSSAPRKFPDIRAAFKSKSN